MPAAISTLAVRPDAARTPNSQDTISFKIVAPRLIGNGWSVFPARSHDRMPAKIGGEMLKWGKYQHERVDLGTLASWIAEAGESNTHLALGSASGGVGAIDIDVLDPILARAVAQLAEDVFGSTPLHRIGRAPKIALLYRFEPTIASRSYHLEAAFEGAKQLVEVLAAGKALTVHGRHHKTGRGFTWPHRDILDARPEELPLVNPGQMATFVERLAALSPLATETKPVVVNTQDVGADVTKSRTGKVVDGRSAHLYRCALDALAALKADAFGGAPGEAELADATWSRFAASADLVRGKGSDGRPWTRNDALAKARWLLRRESERQLIIDRDGRLNPLPRGVIKGVSPRFSTGAEITAAEASRRMQSVLDRAIEAAFDWSQAAAELEAAERAELTIPGNVLAVPAGTGKTTMAIERLAANPRTAEKVVHIYTLTHLQAEELLGACRRAGLSARVVYGRGQPCKADGEPLCLRSKLAEQVARAGLPVSDTLCSKRVRGKGGQMEVIECPHMLTCRQFRYWSQFEEPVTVWIFPHANLWTKHVRGVPEPDLVVIDESFWRGGLADLSFAADRLLHARPYVLGQDDAATLANKRLERDRQYAGSVVHRALYAGEPLLNALRQSKIGADRCRAFAKLLYASLGQGYHLDLRPSDPDQEMAERLATFARSEAVREARMWLQLASELGTERAESQQVVLRLDQVHEGERYDAVAVYWRKSLGIEAPVIVLDAHGEPDILGRFLPRHQLEIERCHLPRLADEVVQVADRTFSRTSLFAYAGADEEQKQAAAKTMAGIASFLDMVARQERCVFVAAVKPAREIFEAELGDANPHMGFGHYNALRGLDRFKEVSAVVVVGAEQSPPRALDDALRSLYGDGEEVLAFAEGAPLFQRQVGYRMRNGEQLGATIADHPDERGQLLMRLTREAEVEQAIDRARLIHRRPDGSMPKVYILTKLPLDITVDRLVSWQDLLGHQPGRVEAAFAESNGVLPLVPSYLAGRFPSLFSRASSAVTALQTVGLVGAIDLLGWATKISYWATQKISVVEFRQLTPAGKRKPGPASRALIGGTPADAAAALSQVLGCRIAELRVIACITRTDEALVAESFDGDEGALALSRVEVAAVPQIIKPALVANRPRPVWITAEPSPANGYVGAISRFRHRVNDVANRRMLLIPPPAAGRLAVAA